MSTASGSAVPPHDGGAEPLAPPVDAEAEATLGPDVAEGVGSVPMAPAGDATGMGRSTALMASGTLVSRILGLVRAAMVVWAIGATGDAANAFAAANKLPNVLYLLIAGGVLNAVLVPQVVRAYRRADGQQYVDRLLTLGATMLLGLALLLTLAAPLLTALYTDFSDPAVQSLTVLLAYWCIPQIFFYGLYSLLGQVLNARGSFGPYMWAPVVNNLVSMAGLLVFVLVNGSFQTSALEDPSAWGGGQVALLACTATVGVAAQALVLLIPLYRSGFRYRPRWGFRGVGLRSAGRVAGWTFAALVVGQLGVLAVSRVTSRAGSLDPAYAGNALWDYAFLVFMLPHSLVTVSLATALFTRLSATAAAGDVDGVRADLSLGLRTVGLFTVLATAAIAVLAYPIGRVMFPSGGDDAWSALAPVIVAMVLGLVAFGAWSLCQRVFYAYEDARSMFPMQVGMAVVVVAGTYLAKAVLEPSWWVAGAGLASSLSYVVGAIVALIVLRRRLHGVDGRRVAIVHAKAVGAAIVAAAVGLLVVHLLGPVSGMGSAIVTCVTAGLAIGLVYVLLLKVLRVREVDALVQMVIRRARGRRR
ncbi:murein biosynthesis integral membrane protein MurJ [Cellulomonas timonensis]|uniref:murein biosynthesis integral membrane protein MurJ n=1 Tax=Cellulomonas timonensis TaxID=1689271 RepID=UPI000A69D60A|nr:murein biosynthesis integral membrane protein MurJ [Cellulomonas timonensis]